MKAFAYSMPDAEYDRTKDIILFHFPIPKDWEKSEKQWVGKQLKGILWSRIKKLELQKLTKEATASISYKNLIT